MHLNAFFLRQLAARLDAVLAGAVVEEVFTQERDELVLALRLPGGGEFTIRASLRAELTYLAFPDAFARARANTVTLFEAIGGLAVLGVSAVAYDRSFYIELQGGLALLYKLHGNRANVCLLTDGAVTEVFKKSLAKDWGLTLAGLASAPDLSRAAFDAAGAEGYKLLPQIGPEGRAWLDSQGYGGADAETRWVLFGRLMDILEKPEKCYLTTWQGRTQLLLFAAGEIEETFTDALEAARAFGRVVAQRFYVEDARTQAQRLLATRHAQTAAYLDKLTARQAVLEQERSPKEVADLVLAQPHRFGQGAGAPQRVELDDFYTGGTVTVELKAGQTPQALAAQLYRKAKNRGQELAHIAEQLAARRAWLARLADALAVLPTLDDVRAIRALTAGLGPGLAEAQDAPMPYRAVYIDGYEVRIGKNAAANDEMLRAHSRKDDLWLHARGAAGSHVIIVRKPGQTVPKPVIEKAAALAAWHSKKRTESLADVQVAERKYVRKPKGAPAGMVVVSKEQVLLVRPGE